MKTVSEVLKFCKDNDVRYTYTDTLDWLSE